ncbi:hypothetical protein KIN20_028763 [Parelaphostrongylus tenuis]|uniref:Uncharacterized protein n=1 Tax=Parelaphostrongylus tenuis TaxID=148309 RepID=A0AAD5WEY5_PARTN|nr:hypothetical protein KIN20_028763 [Parelaphostrongylus tenuis]
MMSKNRTNHGRVVQAEHLQTKHKHDNSDEDSLNCLKWVPEPEQEQEQHEDTQTAGNHTTLRKQAFSQIFAWICWSVLSSSPLTILDPCELDRTLPKQIRHQGNSLDSVRS